MREKYASMPFFCDFGSQCAATHGGNKGVSIGRASALACRRIAPACNRRC